MSQAAVGHRSAHRPQCRQTSSSLTITRAVGKVSETYKSCVGLSAGTFSLARKSFSSSSFFVNVMQEVGQTSTQASHSMHFDSVKTVCTSQFKQRCASLKPANGSKPNSTSFLRSFKVIDLSACGTI